MVQLLNSIYLGAATPSDYGKAAGVIELLPFEYYLGAAVPSHGKPTVNVLLSGVSPLTLLNAVSLNYIKAFGKCEQASTPTPTSPVNIVANNGAIKVKDDELPVGYKRLSYIESSGAQIIDTDYILQETDSVEVDYNITNRSRTGDKFIIGCQPIADNPNIGMWVETYGNQNSWYVRFGSPSSVNTSSTSSQLSGTLKVSKGSFIVNGVEILQPAYNAMSPNQMSIFNRRSSNGSVPTAGCSAQVRGVRILNGNNIIRKYIPCESPDNILGLYEVTQGEFLTNNGDGDFTAGSYDTSHLTEIYYDGTVETVSIGKGFDSADGQGTFVSPGSSATTRIYKAFGQLPDGRYKVAITGNFEFIFQYKDSMDTFTDYGNIDTWTTSGVYDLDKTGYYYGIAIRYPNNGTIRPSDFNGVISLIPVDNSATCQPLLSVSTYKDVQNITNGAITRNVGVKVLNGTEDWQYSQALLNYMYSLRIDGLFAEDISVTSGRKTPYCTHFVRSEQWKTSTAEARNNAVQAWRPSSGSSVIGLGYNYASAEGLADFKAWLASQYAAGTPVIVVYPLATPTTETVTGQTLTITQGTNIVTAEGSVSDLELEVSYKAYAEVTVEEIEAVNTDENVEVIIS